MKVGHRRVSTQDQQLDLQLHAMQEANCEKVFQDVMSGAKTDRPGLKEALNYVREGDILVVWKLDRLGRSLPHLIEVITQLDARSVGFICLKQNLDTTPPGGRLIFHIFGAIAQFERELIRERTMAGLQSARARGRFGGRPRSLSAAKIKLLRSMHAEPPKPRAALLHEACNL